MGIIGLLLLVLFALENARTVRVRFLLVETETWLALALVLSAVLGFLVGFAWSSLRHRTRPPSRQAPPGHTPPPRTSGPGQDREAPRDGAATATR